MFFDFLSLDDEMYYVDNVLRRQAKRRRHVSVTILGTNVLYCFLANLFSLIGFCLWKKRISYDSK